MYQRILHILHTIRARSTDYLRTLCSWFSALPRTTRIGLCVAGIAFGAVLLAFYVNVYRAPADFPERTVIDVAHGSSLREIATQFEEQHIVRSAAWLEMFVALFAGDGGAQAGEYFFDTPENIFAIAHALAFGEYGVEPIRVTIPEGSTVVEIAEILSAELPSFDTEMFVQAAHPYEGFLFPDTYDFLATVSTDTVIRRMRTTFERRIEPLAPAIAAHAHSKREIITMASLLEKEAHVYEDKQRIAGVLWKRIEIGMPLQVDAVFPYINGKNTFELTYADLDIDSPYNTYRYRGLPPGPIANPGLESIKAAMQPEETEYLYYLSDYDGNLYYSETFDEHVRKKNIYLP